jgi:eukaryotic-like serine/threonine-protein kinase
MCTGGGENLDDKADIEFQKNSELPFADLASRDLVALWHAGSQAAARVLLARYEVRLVALVAARLNRKYRDTIAPEDVVQSAMGSFFRVTSAGTKPSIELDSSASAWNILATFARRKLSRALERETAFKRGGGWDRAPLDELEPDLRALPSETDVDDTLAELNSLLSDEQAELLELLVAGATQKEIAERMGVDERTIRRRVTALRAVVSAQRADHEASKPATDSVKENVTLPNITYRQFVLGKMVGRGALGKVYRARLQSNGRVIAVKFMHRHLWTDPNSRLSFLREIDHASKIDHPGIMKYLGWGQSPHGGPYLVCEYVDGQALTNSTPNDLATAVQWLIQVCDAIAAAHQAGVTHGDLTPNNVLLSHDGRIVITDFGLAAYTLESLGGTLGFAAPEQISTAFGHISFATDVYAIGGLAYYLLTGKAPHDRNSDSLLEMVSEEDVVLLKSRSITQAESKLVDVANLALKKAINCRPKSVMELAALLSE